MASLVKKKKGNRLYYYLVESARVDGKPRIVHQAYLGTAEKLAELVQQKIRPSPPLRHLARLRSPRRLVAGGQSVRRVATTGIPVAFSAFRTLVPLTISCSRPFTASVIPARRPKSAIGTTNHPRFPVGLSCRALYFASLLGRLRTDSARDQRARRSRGRSSRSRAVAFARSVEGKQLVGRRLLAYDTTNFYTYIASTNTRNHLAQRGHNKQGRHNLRQVGLSYVLDGESGLSLCHHVYPGNVADVEEFSVALERIVRLLDQNQIARETVTLVFDKGTAALDNTVELEEAGVGWISALPWNQAPVELRERATEQLPPCSAEQPGVRAVAEKLLVHGQEYLAVLKYSAPFAAEQLHSLTTSISRALQFLRRFAKELNKPRARWTEEGITRKIQKWLSGQFLSEVIRYQLESRDGQWRLQFDFDQVAFERLLGRRLGRTVLLTNRMDWAAEQVVAGYAGQQQVERVFRGLKDGEWLAWGPMHHWTDRKIRIHAFYCMLGISLLQYVHRQAKTAWSDLSMEQLIEELQQIQQFILLYPRQGEKGPDRAAYVLSKQTLAQQALAKALKLDELQITHRG